MMKIFFIRIAPNNIAWSLKGFPVMRVTEFPRKPMIFSCVFMFSAYCRVSYSNACSTASLYRKRVSFVRARSRK